jgi:hypothetical protein
MKSDKFNKKETVDVLEAVLFTKININILGNMPFSRILPFLHFISYEHNLPFRVEGEKVIFTEYGYKKASAILKKSIQYN